MDAALQKYIKPKEFTFCSKCGEICKQTDRDFMCTSCQRGLFGYIKRNDKEVSLQIRFEKLLSDIHKKHREELAKLRQESEELLKYGAS